MFRRKERGLSRDTKHVLAFFTLGVLDRLDEGNEEVREYIQSWIDGNDLPVGGVRTECVSTEEIIEYFKAVKGRSKTPELLTAKDVVQYIEFKEKNG